MRCVTVAIRVPFVLVECDAIVPVARRRRIGQEALSCPADRLILRSRVAYGDTRCMQLRASAAFVGRVRELEVLEQSLSAAQVGSGATVLLTGEAGIGKTRLASELASRA